MAVNLYSSRTLLAALKILAPSPSFLTDTFFGKSRTFATEEVDIDVYEEDRILAPFVRPVAQGKLVEPVGFSTRKYKPPYLKPKRKLEPQDVLDRQAGEGLHVQAGADRLRSNLADRRNTYLQELRNAIRRRIEWMASKALETGQVQVVGDGINETIDYQRNAAHTVAVTSITPWDDPGATILRNLMDWSNLCIQNGKRVPTELVMGTQAFIAFINHPEIQAAMHTNRMQIGNIDVQDLRGGFARVGHINAPMLNVWIYTDWYKDPATGSLTNFMPEKKIFLGAPSTVAQNEVLYGAIMDVDAIEQGLSQTDIFPKTFKDEESGIEFIMLQSAPLIGMHEPNATLCAQVLN
jgi:hypothetical protein